MIRAEVGIDSGKKLFTVEEPTGPEAMVSNCKPIYTLIRTPDLEGQTADRRRRWAHKRWASAARAKSPAAGHERKVVSIDFSCI